MTIEFFSHESRKPHGGSLKPLLVLATIALLFNLGFSLSKFYNWNYDSWSHMFFASHYMKSWFDTWDVRWFGGMSVTSYPPLVTQLMALVGYVVGLQNAYAVLNLAAMIAIPLGVYNLSACFLSRQQAFWAGALAIFLPSTYLAAYAYGQLTTVFALATSLFMGMFLWRYLERGRTRDFLVGSLLLGITSASHQFTILGLVPILVASIFLTFVLYRIVDLRTSLRRFAFFVGIGIVLAIAPIFPFWQFIVRAVPQKPIPHFTRTSIFSSAATLVQLFVAPYLLLLAAVPLAVLAAFKRRRLIALTAAFLVLFTLGLGGTTPFPRIVFGHYWQWLTYDRFTLWAGTLLLPLVSFVIPIDPFRLGAVKKKAVLFPVLAVFLAMSIGGALFGAEPSRLEFLPSPNSVNPAPLLEFLQSNNAEGQYRYITLGFGEAQMERLSVLTNSSSLDGGYFTGRTLPVLTESGIGMIDNSKFVDPQLKTLNTILAHANSYSLKWVFVNDVYYYNTLKEHGFLLTGSAEINHDNRLGGITIWTNETAPPMVGEKLHQVGFASYVWGVAPLLLLAALILLVVPELRSWLKRETNSGDRHTHTEDEE